MLAGTAVGTVSSRSIVEPIRWYFNRSGHSEASFVQATCDDVNILQKQISCTDIRGEKIQLGYDYLVLAVGAEPATFNIPGVKENAMFMKVRKEQTNIPYCCIIVDLFWKFTNLLPYF